MEKCSYENIRRLHLLLYIILDVKTLLIADFYLILKEFKYFTFIIFRREITKYAIFLNSALHIIKDYENIRVILRLQLFTSAIPRRIKIPSEKSFAICAKLSRNCHCKIYRTVAVSYMLRGISRIAIANHAGTIYFYLGRKSPVVMEIYRGLNIDINARQRRRRSRTSR